MIFVCYLIIGIIGIIKLSLLYMSFENSLHLKNYKYIEKILKKCLKFYIGSQVKYFSREFALY